MNAFKCVASGDPIIRQMQQYLNCHYEEYIGLTPCDGIYERNTNKAIIYALQAAEGMPTNVANGNFGPSTKNCCPTLPYNNVEKNYSKKIYNEDSIQKFYDLMQIALYVNGIGDGIWKEYSEFSNDSIIEFQQQYGLPQTGICSLGTWQSLLLSCGDTNREALACDCATILDEDKAKTLYDNNYRYVGRYLSGKIANGASKALSINELKIAFNSGLSIFPIQQSSANNVSYFNESKALEDVNSAYEHALKLGFPKGTRIYFAVDCDPQDYQITSNIIPYFKKVFETMRDNKKGRYKIGIYGTRNVCTKVCKSGYATSSFVSDMSSGFSGNLGYKIPDNWAFDQFATTTVGSGNGKIEIDKDGFSGRVHGYTNDFYSTEIGKVYYSLLEIYNEAFAKKSNVKDANLLTLQYLRHLKSNGAYGNDGEDYDGLWPKMAGTIDSEFCKYIDNKYQSLVVNFNDPIEKIKYDILHFAATLNAYLYPLLGLDIAVADDIADDFAGWAGDLITYADNIKDEAISQEKANKLICSTEEESNFKLEDYLADIDAFNVFKLLDNDSDLSFPEAFRDYFTDKDYETSELIIKTRTVRFIQNIGEIESFDRICDNVCLLNTDPIGYFKKKILKTDNLADYDNGFIKANRAFKLFVHTAYESNR